MATTSPNQSKAIVRIPRPQGITSLSLQYQQENSPVNKRKIQNLTITHYITNQYELVGRGFVTPANLAAILDMPINQLNEELLRRLKMQDEMMGKEGLGQLARASILGSIFEAQQAISLGRNQALILAQAQGQKYVPFLTEQVNRAIANYGSLVASGASIAKHVLPAAPAVQVLNNNQQAIVNNHYIGPDEAQKMVEERTSNLLPGGTEHKALLATKYDIGGLPEVRSNEQQEEAIMAATLSKKAAIERGEMDTQEARKYTQFEAIEDEEIGNIEAPDEGLPDEPKPMPKPLPLPAILKPLQSAGVLQYRQK